MFRKSNRRRMLRVLVPLTVMAGAARAADSTTSSINHAKPTTVPESYWPAPMTQEPALKTSPPVGPFEPTWDSIRPNYKVPSWFKGAKFGLFIHWGLYAVPAYHNEWYARHMYNAFAKYHTETYGPPDQFGYKDFIPMFKAAKFNADEWAEIFKKSGARYVIPCAEHHDGFAMWDSDITPWCAGTLGPKRDFIGELAVAIKKQGLVFGVSSHRMEHHAFEFPAKGLKTDVFDPRYKDFYGPPIDNPKLWTGPGASPEFQEDWFRRCAELVDKYDPQMVWFDNGVNAREYDPIKLKFAAYYYNRAHERGHEVTISTKDSAYLAGSIMDFEKIGARSPKDIRPGEWQVDDPIGSTWGYTSDERFTTTAAIPGKLVDTVSKGGTYLLNLSPNADGVIVDPQPQRLAELGQWLATNGEAIYDTEPWTKFSDGGRSPIRFTT
ncbi:MAG TPA: alpha-L-fucosidase, partial [Tepidisphaeraceae bacterium]|nr:alpha-L-fucosidase [Tepidisphaeraceae bacterium]